MNEQVKVRQRPWALAFRITLPVLMVYVPVGMVFGFLVQQEGYAWYWGPLASLIIFGGSLQFPMLELLLNGNSLFTQALTAGSIASRNAFFGLSFIDRFRGPWYKRAYLAFGLVDATFSILLHGPTLEEEEEDDSYCFAVTFLPHMYWFFGTLGGALVGTFVPVKIPGLEFILTTLFVALATEQYLKTRNLTPYMLAAAAVVLAIAISPTHLMLVGLLICASVILLQGDKA
ncbi:MAG: AzlC family ABC transporter permease [Verrucomicrobia bacterium]|nr:AzlC family ABC transporter permease [Verrucomicrobiota bacterium]